MNSQPSLYIHGFIDKITSVTEKKIIEKYRLETNKSDTDFFWIWILEPSTFEENSVKYG